MKQRGQKKTKVEEKKLKEKNKKKEFDLYYTEANFKIQKKVIERIINEINENTQNF